MSIEENQVFQAVEVMETDPFEQQLDLYLTPFRLSREVT
jgi:hypothetical protein